VAQAALRPALPPTVTQYFTYRGFSLRRADLPVRLLLTAFLCTCGIAVAVGAVNYQLRTGLSAEGSKAWYRGGLAATEADARAPAGTGPGPESGAARTSGADGEAGLYARSPLELMDATHPHLFNQAFLFFVLGHILALCAVGPRLKIAVYLAGFGGVLADTASPWLIRFASSSFAWLQLAGQAAMGLAFAALLFFPLREMWGREARAARRRRGERG